jgi:hypothetical protein
MDEPTPSGQAQAQAPARATASGAAVASLLAVLALLVLAVVAPDDVAALMLLGPADTAHPLAGPGAVPAGFGIDDVHARLAALAGASFGVSGLGLAFTPGVGPLAVALAAVAGTRVALGGRTPAPSAAALAALGVAVATTAVVTLVASGAEIGSLQASASEAAARSGLAAMLGALLAALPAARPLLRAALGPLALAAAVVLGVVMAGGEDAVTYLYHLPDAVAATGLLLLGAPFAGGSPLPIGGGDRFDLLDPGPGVAAWQSTALLLAAVGFWALIAAAAARLGRDAATRRGAAFAGLAAAAITVLACMVGVVAGRLVVGDQRLGADLADFAAGPLVAVLALGVVAGVAGRAPALGYTPARPPDPEEPT